MVKRNGDRYTPVQSTHRTQRPRYITCTPPALVLNYQNFFKCKARLLETYASFKTCFVQASLKTCIARGMHRSRNTSSDAQDMHRSPSNLQSEMQIFLHQRRRKASLEPLGGGDALHHPRAGVVRLGGPTARGRRVQNTRQHLMVRGTFVSVSTAISRYSYKPTYGIFSCSSRDRFIPLSLRG